MGKRRLPLILAIFISSLFITFILFFSYIQMKTTKDAFTLESPYQAALNQPLSLEESRKIEQVKQVERLANEGTRKVSQIADQLTIVRSVDLNYLKMLGSGLILEGRLPQKPNEIILSADLVDTFGLSLDNQIEVNYGQRQLGSEAIPIDATLTSQESFIIQDSESYRLVGIIDNPYNRMTGLHGAYRLLNPKDQIEKTFLNFSNFVAAYQDKDELERIIQEETHKQSPEINFVQSWVMYYRADQTFWQRNRVMILNGFFLVILILVLVFFIKNIFTVWGLEKVRELSMYKSIGSTSWQIYLQLLKDGSLIAIVPLLLGHGSGFVLTNLLSDLLAKVKGVPMLRIPYHLGISLTFLLVTLVMISLAIIAPARRLSQISIIEGLRGNIELSHYQRKARPNFWQELHGNNARVIRSQRYISTIGIFIVALLCFVGGIGRFYEVHYSYQPAYNLKINLRTQQAETPEILKDLKESIEAESSFISTQKYLMINPQLNYSEALEENLLNEELSSRENSEYLEGFLFGLDDQAFANLGGKKGEILLLNQTQRDPNQALDEADYIPYFSSLESVDYSIFESQLTQSDTFKLPIDCLIKDVGIYQERLLPYQIFMYTDVDTFHTYMESWQEYSEEKHSQKLAHNYSLKLKVDPSIVDDLKEYVVQRLKDTVAPSERFEINDVRDAEAARIKDLKFLAILALFTALLVLIFNLTNGYASIQLALQTQSKEIGVLQSLGIHRKDLAAEYQKHYSLEQVKSFVLVFILLAIVILVTSWLNPDLSLPILLNYFPWPVFMSFALIIYLLNIVIFHYSLKRILNQAIIDLIR